jgi:L-serine deaminase
MGGTPEQVLMAAEIAMEHLGLTTQLELSSKFHVSLQYYGALRLLMQLELALETDTKCQSTFKQSSQYHVGNCKRYE